MTDFLSLSFDGLNHFHFLRPLWLLSIVPLLILWLFNSRQKGRTQWHQIIPPHLAHALLDQPLKQNRYLGFSLALIWLLSAIALAGPTWQKIEKPVFQIKRASVILMDMSLSMRATDLKPERLTKAKFKAIDLATAIGDGEVALVAYAGDAFTISPLTPDARNLTALIPSLTPEIMPEKGSYPLLGLEQAAKLLQQAGYVKGDIYWITDGVDQEDLNELRNFASSTQYRISVLGVGTREGAPIKLVDGSLLKDHTGSIVIPKLNASLLTTLPNMTGGIFVPLTANDADVRTLAALTPQKRDTQQDKETDDKLLTGDDWHEFGPYLILIILPFVLLKFRRGEVLSIALLLVLLPPAQPAVANEARDPQNSTASDEEANQAVQESWLDYLFKTPDQVAQEAYQQENFAEAQQRFNDPNWQGSAAYKNGDYETALERYSNDDTAKGWYNRGNTLAQLNKFEEAIEAYEQALKKRPGFGEAKDNKELLEEMLKQQHEQQQQDGENQQNQDQQGGQQQQSDQQDSEQQSSDQSQSSQGDEQQDSQQQSSSNSPQPSEQNDSEQQSKASQQQDSQDQQNPQQQSQGTQAGDESEGDEGEQQAQGMQPLTPEQLAEQEQQQKLEQLLRKVSDDPATLLRNKMILENRRRQRNNTAPKGAKKSW